MRERSGHPRPELLFFGLRARARARARARLLPFFTLHSSPFTLPRGIALAAVGSRDGCFAFRHQAFQSISRQRFSRLLLVPVLLSGGLDLRPRLFSPL